MAPAAANTSSIAATKRPWRSVSAAAHNQKSPALQM
jgi:hypothetical protein